MSTKIRGVNGIIFAIGKKGKKAKPEMMVIPAMLVLRVTKDEHGQSLSLADENNGVMFQIPVEPVMDLIEVKE